MELIIVATLILFLLALSVPFVTSVRADVSLMRTVKQVKTDILATLAYGASGKSFAALQANDLLNPELIPSHYALHFGLKKEPLDPFTYDYLELRQDSKGLSSKQLYKLEKELEIPGVFLKSIRLKVNPNDVGELVPSVWVVFVPPFGKVIFVPGEALSDLKVLGSGLVYSQVELEFAYKDRPQTQVIIFDKGKSLRVE